MQGNLGDLNPLGLDGSQQILGIDLAAEFTGGDGQLFSGRGHRAGKLGRCAKDYGILQNDRDEEKEQGQFQRSFDGEGARTAQTGM
jgi:hypothetical protein